MTDPIVLPPPAPARPSPDRQGMRLRLGLGVVALVGAVLLAFVIPLPGIQLCMFKGVFGRPCPGCGMTRSVVNLAQGDVLASLRYHPLGVVLMGGLLAGIAGAAVGLVRGRDPVWALLERRGPVIVGVFFGALLVTWIVRGFVVPEWAPDPVGTRAHWEAIQALLR